MSEWRRDDGYWVSDEPSLLDVGRIHQWLSEESYWAEGRPFEKTVTAISHSIDFGLYESSGAQVGFCRWVTDTATFAWLCDVFVDGSCRGKGLGVFMVDIAVAHPSVGGLRLLLGTADAHGLYQRFGFSTLPHPERLMEIRPGGTPLGP